MNTFVTNKKTYTSTLNDIKYEILYSSTGKNITFEIISLSNPFSGSYQREFSTEELENINGLFKLIKSKEQYDKLFEKIFWNKQLSLIKNEKEIIFKVDIKLEADDDVGFELSIPKVQMDIQKLL